MKSFSLRNNYEIPVIGTGPGIPKAGARWKCVDWIPFMGRYINAIVSRINGRINQRKWVNRLAASLKLGYRMIDYSSAYGNEQLLKKAAFSWF